MKDIDKLLLIIISYLLVFGTAGALRTNYEPRWKVEHPKPYVEEALCMNTRDYVSENMRHECEMLAKLTWCEAGAVKDEFEQRCVMWVALNIHDTYGDESIEATIRSPGRFWYLDEAPVTPKLYAMAQDVLTMWLLGEREIPIEYIYFSGDGVHNYFYTDFDNPVYTLFREVENERN